MGGLMTALVNRMERTIAPLISQIPGKVQCTMLVLSKRQREELRVGFSSRIQGSET